MYKKSIGFSVLVAIFIAVALFYKAQAQTNTSFLVNLKLGDRNSDVLQLQKFLNSDIRTQIAVSGDGSRGQETGYFGNLTKNAVIKFQELYSSEVLSPAGLYSGSGFVGALTRNKLNTLVNTNSSINSGSNQNQQTNTQTVTVVSGNDAIDIYATDKKADELQKKVADRINNAIAARSTQQIDTSDLVISVDPNQVFIRQLSTNTGKVGSVLTIGGSGITATGNDVYFGNGFVLKNIPSKNGVITIKVPSIPAGRYDIAIKNNNGLSNTSFFIITSSATKQVSIQSVDPVKVSYGQTLVVHGTGFTPTNNEVVTTFGRIKGLPSADGTTLNVVIAPESLKEASKLSSGDKEYKVDLYIINDNGFTAPAKFTFTF